MEDNWKHRSAKMRCGSCMWFVEKVPILDGPHKEVGMFGRCRQSSPTIKGFPAVYGTDWCGDHKLDENKV